MTYSWGDGTPFHTYHRYLQNTLGYQVRKIPVDAGFTCPNRDGTVGTGGCTFCLNEAFTPHYCNSRHSITQQIHDGVAFHAQRRRPIDKFFVYFQAFSNTHAPTARLRECYNEALAIPHVQGLIIATRPDCLTDEVLDYLEKLQENVYLCVEIGIESLHDETLRRINRGHDTASTLRALDMLANRHIPVCGHLIFGLPGETPELWLQDTAILNRLPIATLKLHQLQILSHTPIEQEWVVKPEDFHTFTAEGYITFLTDYIERLSPTIAIERLANEVPTRYLASPSWHGIRHQEIVQAVIRSLEARHSWQGKKKAEP